MPTLMALTHINIDTGLLMTNDEMETRITRLETQLVSTQALLHCLLPAIPPERRHLVLDQFRQWCCATEAKVFQDDPDPQTADWQLAQIAAMYQALEGALKLVSDWEDKHSKGV